MNEVIRERLLSSIATHRTCSLSRSISSQRPYVTLTFAQSLDGSIAAIPGQHLVISSKQSLRITHELRILHDGILVGIGTIISDNPHLTSRLVHGTSPKPIVIDPHIKIPITSNVLKRPCVLICSRIDMPEVMIDGIVDMNQACLSTYSTQYSRLLDVHNASPECVIIALSVMDGSGRFVWHDILSYLNTMFCSIMIEGGQYVITSLISHINDDDDPPVDHMLITIAPFFLGGPRSINRLMPSPIRLYSTLIQQCSRDAIIQGFTRPINVSYHQRSIIDRIVASIQPYALVAWFNFNMYGLNKILCRLLTLYPGIGDVKKARTRILAIVMILIMMRHAYTCHITMPRHDSLIDARSHVVNESHITNDSANNKR